MQQLARGTVVGIGYAVIVEVLEAEATLILEPPVAGRYRHISGDAIILARLQFETAVIAFIGQRLQRFGIEGLLCGTGHRMQLANIAAVVHHLACDNQIVLVVDGDLHIVACYSLAILDQKPGVRIGQRQLRLTAFFQPGKVGLRARALGHQRRHLGADIPTISSAAAARTFSAVLLRLRRIVVFKRLAVSLDLQIQLCDLFFEPLAREDGSLAGIAVEERAVDCHDAAADQVKLAKQQHEAAVHRLQRFPVLLAEIGYRPIARPQVLQKPDQFQIAAGFPFQPSRRADLIGITIKVQLQQVGRVIRRLSGFVYGTIRMAEAELCKVKRTNKALDRPDKIIRPDIVLNPRRKKTGLLPALTGLECTIRHTTNLTSISKSGFLPSLDGQITHARMRIAAISFDSGVRIDKSRACPKNPAPIPKANSPFSTSSMKTTPSAPTAACLPSFWAGWTATSPRVLSLPGRIAKSPRSPGDLRWRSRASAASARRRSNSSGSVTPKSASSSEALARPLP